MWLLYHITPSLKIHKWLPTTLETKAQTQWWSRPPWCLLTSSLQSSHTGCLVYPWTYLCTSCPLCLGGTLSVWLSPSPYLSFSSSGRSSQLPFSPQIKSPNPSHDRPLFCFTLSQFSKHAEYFNNKTPQQLLQSRQLQDINMDIITISRILKLRHRAEP